MRTEAQVRALLLDLLREQLYGHHSALDSWYLVGRVDTLRWMLEDASADEPLLGVVTEVVDGGGPSV